MMNLLPSLPPNVVRARELAEAAASIYGTDPSRIEVRTRAVGPLTTLTTGLLGFRTVATVILDGEEVVRTHPVEDEDLALEALGWLS